MVCVDERARELLPACVLVWRANGVLGRGGRVSSGRLELALGLGMHEGVQGHPGRVNGKVRRAAEVQVLLATLECIGIKWHGMQGCSAAALWLRRALEGSVACRESKWQGC